MTPTSARGRLRSGRDFAAYCALGVAIAIGGSIAVGRVPPAAIGVVLCLVLIAAGWFACRRGGRVDEVSLAAVKFSWLWGGFAGVAIGAGFAAWAAAAGGGIDLALPDYDSAALRGLATGILIVIAAQFGLYALVLAAWWRRHLR